MVDKKVEVAGGTPKNLFGASARVLAEVSLFHGGIKTQFGRDRVLAEHNFKADAANVEVANRVYMEYLDHRFHIVSSNEKLNLTERRRIKALYDWIIDGKWAKHKAAIMKPSE